MSLVQQELLILPEYLSSPPGFGGVRVPRFQVFCVVFCRSLFVPLYVFFLVVLLSDFRFTDFDYLPFGVFNLLLPYEFRKKKKNKQYIFAHFSL